MIKTHTKVVKLLLKLEGVLVFVASLIFYWKVGSSWWLFIALVLVPDLGMVGYLRDKRIGAVLYNLTHTYSSALLLLLVGVLFDYELVLSLGLILTAHIGIDRALGYGLKYSTNFKHTHMQRV